jgi:PAS domain S-box-containing protein
MPVRLQRILESGALMENRTAVEGRRCADQELADSEARYRALAENSPLAIFVVREGNVLLVNPACVKLFGACSPEELLGRSALGLFDHDSQALVRKRMLVGSRTVPCVEVRIGRLDGTAVDVEAGASPYLDQGVKAIQVVLHDITERKQAQQALAESEARYRLLTETSSLGIVVCRNDGHDDAVLVVNPACMKIFGASSPHDLIGKSLLGLFHPDSRRTVRQLLEAASGDVVPLVDVQIVRADLTVVDVSVVASPMLQAGVAAFNIVLRDVSETKHLLAAQAKLVAIIKSSPDAILTTSLDRTVTSWNPAAEALYGYAADEMIGSSIEVLAPPGHEGESRELTDRILAGDAIAQYDTQRVRKNGSLVDVALTLFPIRDEGGDVSGISVVAQDVTDHKRLEQERLLAEKFFRDTFEHADVGIAHVDPADGTYLRVNQHLCELLGYTREELLATTFSAITHPDDVDENTRHLRMLLAGEESTYSADKRYLRKDGSIVWVHLNITMIRKQDGTPDYNLDVITDITERKRMEASLQQSEQKFRNLFNNAEVGMFRTKADGSEFLDLNDKYLGILGYPREELIGKPMVNVWADPCEREAMVRTLEETGQVVDLEFDLLTKQGDVKRCLTSLKLDPDAGILEGSLIDITERKKAEELAARQAERIERTLTSVIDIASNIVELRDPYTAGHQRRVSELAVRIAENLGMSGHEIDDIRVAGLLHDMGKAAIPAEILSKPGQLSPIEFTLIQAHPEAGYRLAVSANMAEPISEMIYQHHERCDGSGYPRGLTADQTLLGAKVLAVADVVEAMMSHRPYRPALGIGAALAEIERGTGTLYDPWVSEACMRVFNEDGFEFSKS